MPLSHIHGLVAGLLATLYSAGSLYCLPTADVRVLPEILAEDRPTWYSGVPAMHHAVVEAAERAVPPWRHYLRFIRSASSPLPPVLLERVEAAFGVPVIEAYGMTEASHQVASNPLPPGRRRPGSVGAATGTEIRVVNAHGRPLPPGETGSVVIRGAGVMSGYLDAPAEESFTSGWLRTGDEGFLDQDGYLHLRGRTKEVINRGGEKIFPQEIDEVLLTHPKVVEAAAFALLSIGFAGVRRSCG
jgi:acyl-CoA synthetase (AMP-forming)/AMP-acid ligase II